MQSHPHRHVSVIHIRSDYEIKIRNTHFLLRKRILESPHKDYNCKQLQIFHVPPLSYMLKYFILMFKIIHQKKVIELS